MTTIIQRQTTTNQQHSVKTPTTTTRTIIQIIYTNNKAPIVFIKVTLTIFLVAIIIITCNCPEQVAACRVDTTETITTITTEIMVQTTIITTREYPIKKTAQILIVKVQ